jgi:hypothetical protein
MFNSLRGGACDGGQPCILFPLFEGIPAAMAVI